MKSVLRSEIFKFTDKEVLNEFLNKKVPQFKEDTLDKKWKKFINLPSNFFKHYDTEPKNEIDFNPQTTELIIADAIALERAIFGVQLTKPSIVFSIFLYNNYPVLLVEDDFTRRIKEINPFSPTSKKLQYLKFLSSLENYNP